MSSPYSIREHPGAQIAKMMLNGIVIGIGVMGALASFIGFSLGFLAGVFVVVVQWAQKNGASYPLCSPVYLWLCVSAL